MICVYLRYTILWISSSYSQSWTLLACMLSYYFFQWAASVYVGKAVLEWILGEDKYSFTTTVDAFLEWLYKELLVACRLFTF